MHHFGSRKVNYWVGRFHTKTVGTALEAFVSEDKQQELSMYNHTPFLLLTFVDIYLEIGLLLRSRH